MPPRREIIRVQNDRIALAARSHHFEDVRVPFLCECDETSCREFIMLTLADFDALRARNLYLVAGGHPFPGGVCIESRHDFDAFRLSA